MNSELQKANQVAQEKLEQIKADMESEMTASIDERTKALEEDYTRQCTEIQKNASQSHKQILDRQLQEHNWKIREISQESQYKLQD